MRVGARPDGPLDLAGMRLGLAPTPLFEGYFALILARSVMAGHRLGIYDALAEREDTSDGLAERLGLDPDGADALLRALAASGYVERAGGGRWRNGRETRRWLLKDSPRELRGWMDFTYDMWEAFSGLEEAVRTGESQGLHSEDPDDPYWERYMRGLFSLSQVGAPVVTRLIDVRSPRSMLDLAGGHGGYAMALCRKHPGLRARVIELEGAARIGRRIVEEQGMSDRVEHVVGDLFESDLGTGHDLVTAIQIAHHFDHARNVTMARRALDALRPGGTFAIVEEERHEDGGGRGEQIGAFTGLLFYVTSHARTYSAEEYESVLREAGFTGVRTRRDPRMPGTCAVLGARPG